MISITGSTRAGAEVARNAAATVKRVHQELGGKSANIILDDEDLASNVSSGVASVMSNSGQTCSAPTRMLVPERRMDEAIAAARAAAEEITVGDPHSNARLGPVVSKAQWERIQRLIQAGIDEGAGLVAGGVGKPQGLEVGHYVRPTVFACVTSDMAVAREEIFGPVLSILGYASTDDAVATSNDSDYGLAGYVSGRDLEVARSVARRLRAGQIALNGAFDLTAPFGGYKRSGNGREWGELAFHEFLETKAVVGYAPAAAE
jgi:aldehyde dehydrogenase (NAD+)